MSVYCPIVKRKVPYIFCEDCDDKPCKKTKTKPQENKKPSRN